MLALAPTAQATSYRDVSLEELTARSTVVVEAEVTKVRHLQQPGRLPVVTMDDLRVIRYLRGSGPSQITLWQPGGVIDELRFEIVGSPRFKVGQRVILFLKPKPGYGSVTFYLFGLELGAYQVQRGSDGVLWAVRPSHRASNGGAQSALSVPQPSASQSLPQALPLWQLVARIKGVR